VAKSWTCGDCRTAYPKSVLYCTRPFDDYLALRGGSIESAITRAVEKAIAPIVQKAERRLSRNREPAHFAIAA
jgi:hypothetical protein